MKTRRTETRASQKGPKNRRPLTSDIERQSDTLGWADRKIFPRSMAEETIGAPPDIHQPMAVSRNPFANKKGAPPPARSRDAHGRANAASVVRAGVIVNQRRRLGRAGSYKRRPIDAGHLHFSPGEHGSRSPLTNCPIRCQNAPLSRIYNVDLH